MKRIEMKSGAVAFLGLLLVLCTMLGVLFTQGRYVENAQSGSDIYGSDMEYIIAEQVEVRSVEELIAAIENGYSNIKISDEVDNPLVIISGVTDVGADLILDLNGHEIQRNNREPMLNITEGVRMTIIDSSQEQTGSFYNPVGSVLQIGGGTLTVSAGAFVSGPKKSEYAQESADGWTAAAAAEDNLNGVQGTGGTFGAESVTAKLFEKNISGDGYVSAGEIVLPVIQPYVAEREYTAGGTGKYWFVNGNMYFDKGTVPDPDVYPSVLQEDTYLYYVVDDEAVSYDSIFADENTADFYYSYQVQRSAGADGKPSYSLPKEGAAEEDLFTVSVYGYHDVKETAEKNAGDESFATVRMRSGNMYARGGSYSTYFGTGHAYGIYASGGYMAVEAGGFEAIEGGVCINCTFDEGTDRSTEYLRVSGGSFGSENGDTVQVNRGRMVVTGGSFEKNSTNTVRDEAAASIHITGDESTLSVSNAAFTMTGSVQYGVWSQGGSVDLTDTSIDVNVEQAEDGSISMRSAGSDNYGVYAEGGRISLHGECAVRVGGTSSAGILAEGGSISYAGSGSQKLTVAADMGSNTILNTSAVAAISGSITFTGNVDVVSNGLGIVVYGQEGSGRNELRFTGGGTLTVNSSRATGLYVSGGDAVFGKKADGTPGENAEVGITTAITENCALESTTTMYHGVFVQGGSLDASGAEFSVTHTGIDNTYSSDAYTGLNIRSYAVYVTGDAADEVKLSEGKIRNTKGGGGLYVSGGVVSLGQGVSVSAEGSSYDNRRWYNVNGGAASGDAWDYRKNVDGGNAVEVSGGSLTIDGGTYSANMGNGILVRNGEATVNGGTFIGADAYDPNSNDSRATAGVAASYAFKMYGGTLTVNGGTFMDPYAHNGSQNETYRRGSGAFVMGASAENKGTVTINSATIDVGGTAAFAVYSNVNVTFGKEGAADDTAVRFAGESAAITVEDTSRTISGNSGSSVIIHCGTYICNEPKDSGGSDGIYYGESSTFLSINGGIFSGVGENYDGTAGRSGIYFEDDPGTNVKLYGGTYIGGDPGERVTPPWVSNPYYYERGALSCPGGFSLGWGWQYTGIVINYGDIINSGTTVRTGSNVSEAQSGAVLSGGTVHENFAAARVVYITTA